MSIGDVTVSIAIKEVHVLVYTNYWKISVAVISVRTFILCLSIACTLQSVLVEITVSHGALSDQILEDAQVILQCD